MLPLATRHRVWFEFALLVSLAVVPYLGALDNYYFYDDGRLLREGVRVEHEGWRVLFEGGFNGTYRPLPIASSYVIHRIFGFESPVPFHVLAVGLHAVNVLLIYGLLARMLGDRGGRLALLAAALCAVQWAGSEAVTYIAALGVSWSAWGGLLAAHGALGWRSARDWRAWSLIVAGVVVSLGGGEYGLALAPLIACCALWPNESGQPNWRQAIAIGAALAPLYAAYVAASVGFNDRGRLGTHYFVGTHVLAQIADNLGYLLLPKNWIRPLPCLALAGALLAVGCAVSRSFRARLLSWPSLLLLGSAVAALAPFSLSLAGNYYRFVYPAMAPFCGWLMFCAGGLIGPQSSPRGVGRRALVGVAVFLMVAGLINGRKRALDERRRGDEVARFVERFDVLAARHPGQPIDVYVDKDIESAIDTVVALGRIPRDNCHEGPPPREEAPGQIALVATYAWGKPFEFRLLEPARKTAARTTPATDR